MKLTNETCIIPGLQKFNFCDPFAIGIDQLLGDVSRLTKTNSNASYPPHNLIKVGEDKYLLELALAGFYQDQLDVKLDKSVLSICGTPICSDGEKEYIHKGISSRAFTRRFSLAEYVEVTSCTFQNGILKIHLERLVPEEKKPRSIKISL
jgi:molecular chaperone IbpA